MKTTDGPEIRAIPTIYKGIEFRSRLEADVAAFMDRVAWTWEYEPRSFLLSNGIHYRPDFFVGRRCRGLWIECRGYTSSKGEAQLEEFFHEAAAMRCEFMVIHAGEERGCDLNCSPVWLYRCQACKRYDVFGENQFEPTCRLCGCVSPTIVAEHIQFKDNTLFIGDHPICDWRPISG